MRHGEARRRRGCCRAVGSRSCKRLDASIAAAAGRDIRLDLAVGPDPQVDADSTPEIPADQAAVDAGMRWMVDFDEAEAAGMGLRIPLTAANLAGSIESLIVLGVEHGRDRE